MDGAEAVAAAETAARERLAEIAGEGGLQSIVEFCHVEGWEPGLGVNEDWPDFWTVCDPGRALTGRGATLQEAAVDLYAMLLLCGWCE